MINYETIIVITYLVITILSFYPIIYQLALIGVNKRGHTEEPSMGSGNEGGGRVIIVVPAKSEPLDLIEESMARLSKIRQYVDVVYVLDNYSDELLSRVRALGDKYGVRILHREKPRGYKGGALNYVIKRLELGDGDYMLVLDVDSILRPEVLSRFMSQLGASNALVPHWVAGNWVDSLLARGQWIGYLLFFKVLKALEGLVGWVPILGSGSLVSVGAVRGVGYWPEDVLEDVELGVRFFTRGLRIKYLDDALVTVEVPVNYHAFVRQQLRWSFGTGRVLRKYSLAVLGRRHGFTVLLYLGQYFAYVLQLLSIAMLAVMSMLGIGIPLWAFVLLVAVLVPSLLTYLYVLLRLDIENGGNPARDVFAVNSVNLAFIMALPRIAIANLMGLLGIGRFEWIPTPKGSQRWVREGINLVPEFLMPLLLAVAFIIAVVHSLWINALILLPYLAGYIRGLWRILKGSL